MKPYTSIIHEMWATSEIPLRWKHSTTTWITMNKDFVYCLWTDAELEAFVVDEHRWLLWTYHSYRYPIQRWDAVRYMLLYHYGGTYVDLDAKCLTPLSVVFAKVPVEAGAIVVPTWPLGLTQDFIAVRRPRNPVLRGVLSGLRRAAASWWYLPLPYTSVLFRTGPVYFTRRVNCHYRQEQIFVIPPSKYRKCVSYVGGASWHSWDGWIIWNTYLSRYYLLWLITLLFVIVAFVRVLSLIHI